MYNIKLTEDQLQDLISNLDQCESEGYLNYDDPAYDILSELKELKEMINAAEQKTNSSYQSS